MANREDTTRTKAENSSLLFIMALLRVLARELHLLLGCLLLLRLSPSDSLLSFRPKFDGAGDGDGDDGYNGGSTGGDDGGCISGPDEVREGTEAARRRRLPTASSSSALCCCMALDFQRPSLSLPISRYCGRLSFLPLLRIPFLPSVTPVCGRSYSRESCSEGWPSSEGNLGLCLPTVLP